MSTPVLVVSGVSSDVGKTSVAVGIMAALTQRGLRVQPFKVGPDYLDTMHHTVACGGIPSVNLDGFMMGYEGVIQSFTKNCAQSQADIAVIEGCMGLFDGKDGHTDCGSTAEIAKWLNAPVVLVVDAWCLGRSAAAILHGYASFDPSLSIVGVIFNKIGGESHAQWLRDAILSTQLTSSISVFGCVPKNINVVLPERHLGLHMPSEHKSILEPLRTHMAAHINLDLLVHVAQSHSPKKIITPLPTAYIPFTLPLVRIGVARDEAFCFYYHDNFKQLEAAGASLVFFSPMHDTSLPENLHAIYFGGGYPELHAQTLQDNHTMRIAVRNYSLEGGLIYAECGGLMYLGQQLCQNNDSSEMCGVLPFNTTMTPRMIMGYCSVTPSTALSTLLRLPKDQTFRCHQYHFSEATHNSAPIELLDEAGHGIGWRGVAHAAFNSAFERPTIVTPSPEGVVIRSTIATYCHLHFSFEFASAIICAARRSMKCISFESSATEMLGAIWSTPSQYTSVPSLVGISEFCDYPNWLTDPLPKLTLSMITAKTSEEIERQVQEFHAKGERDLHTINVDVLASTKPDVVFTQDACDRCSTTDSALVRAMDKASLHHTSSVLCRPLTVVDILDQILKLGHIIGESDRSFSFRNTLTHRLDHVKQLVSSVSRWPTVLGLESIFPLVTSGQWLPDMRQRAGGIESLKNSTTGCPPRRLQWSDIVESAPEIIVISCCGKTALESAMDIEMHAGPLAEFWNLPALRFSPPHLFVVDHDILSRPGPRVVDGIEILAALFHPQLDITVHSTANVLQYIGPVGEVKMFDHFMPVILKSPQHQSEAAQNEVSKTTWHQVENLSGPVAMSAHVLLPWRRSLLLLAGDMGKRQDASLTIWQCDLNEWKSIECSAVYGEDVPTRRTNHAAAIWDDRILLVFGGWDVHGLQSLAEFELLDLKSLCWTHGSTVGPLPSPRGNPTLVIDPKLQTAIVFGGWNGTTRFNDLHALDLSSWTWSKVLIKEGDPVPSPRTDHSAVWWSQGDCMVVFGGSGTSPLNDVWFFHPTTGSWESVECTGISPSPRTSHAAVIHGSLMFVSGGQSHNSNPSVFSSVYVLNLDARAWTSAPQLFRSSCRHSMAIIDDVMYCYGGYDGYESTNQLSEWRLPSEWKIDTTTIAYEKIEERSESQAILPTWTPTTPLTWDNIEQDDAFAEDIAEIDEMDDEDQPSERYRLLHRVACERGYRQYVDPGSGYTVFTALYLKERSCCGYRCRHCPWGHKNVAKQSQVNQKLEL